ncbi:MAG TPA: type II toxin-antitoxin system HicA family toxin [Cyanobacteria bacterium UBA11149]|nr:type II toxin-antitoxin system HicA family toxin [Cyanobacteria bacterium UBA11367]HBE61032.1 type II toxin-antitoxin system HicA family toxin [Cyanobacteria bacterium UBA11366]HBK65748.1 type II toxin-antitoxin system HicA family toxin [Cyanobacteria bacterium UBA11166]HBR72677.1 type II toxin-antitoxin system HicA family toxin [Cyanobacteria bacterium UBA11159]HBS69954.1 type II toxin-antitoxin system HicA family toxin [Cyanobacteria bacterium UBA11153]HBW90190.1 type II toxin-antitoxin s
MLQKAGFSLLPKRGKGSHSYWIHPLLPNPVVIFGKDGNDAKHYQTQDVKAGLAELKQLQQEDES